MRILIAEDHPDNREMLTRRLVRKGYEVHCAENGAEAVEMAQSCAPDLILMDISMPVMSGIEATKVIRNTPDVSKVKIVAPLPANDVAPTPARKRRRTARAEKVAP